MNQCRSLLGVTTEQVIESIKTVLEAEKHYERLRDLATNERQISIIDSLIIDQRETYTVLIGLYKGITCMSLIMPPITKPSFTSYLEGIKQAIRQEWEENIRIELLYSITTVQKIQKVFIEVLFKTYMHSTYLNYLLTINMC